MHRFKPKSENGFPVLLIHGSIEDSRIFYSKNGKGFAPFLAQNGFDVFVPDLPGKGQSIPKVTKNFIHSQQFFIDSDFSDYLSFIKKFYPSEKIRIATHSWGGVLTLAWYAKYGIEGDFGPMIFFGSKRRIAVKSPRRFFMIDLMWTTVGSLSTAISGYLPAKKMRMGSDNEPADFYKQTNKWVYSKKWIDQDTGENISDLLKNKILPPILFFAAINDKVLGHPLDVERLMKEAGGENSSFVLLSKSGGNLKDYNHIDMLTAPEGPEDHFKTALAWLNEGNLS